MCNGFLNSSPLISFKIQYQCETQVGGLFMVDYKALGKNIRKYRIRAGLRQEDLAEKCDCSNSHIGQVENARTIPSLEMVLNIANALDVTVDQLLIASIDHAEVVFLREMEERIRKLPTATKIMACDELSNLLAIIERVHK